MNIRVLFVILCGHLISDISVFCAGLVPCVAGAPMKTVWFKLCMMLIVTFTPCNVCVIKYSFVHK